jgi:hypothetical protein
MSDPISVRHVIATGDYTERIQKSEAVQDQNIREHFAKELERQDELKRSQVNKGDESDEVRIRDQEEKKQQRQQEERQEAAQETEEEPPSEAPAAKREHIIDLRV